MGWYDWIGKKNFQILGRTSRKWTGEKSGVFFFFLYFFLTVEVAINVMCLSSLVYHKDIHHLDYNLCYRLTASSQDVGLLLTPWVLNSVRPRTTFYLSFYFKFIVVSRASCNCSFSYENVGLLESSGGHYSDCKWPVGYFLRTVPTPLSRMCLPNCSKWKFQVTNRKNFQI